MDEPEGTHRTRSRAAPDWSVEQALILVNEINSVESEWGANLPSFQKWQQIVENCNSLDVNRNLNQCKRKWESLLSDYRLIKNGAAGINRSFTVDLVNAIDRCVTAKAKKNGGGGIEADEEDLAVVEPEQAVMDTDPDSDPEAQGRATEFFLERGSKKQGRRMKRQKRRVVRLNPWGYSTSGAMKHEESSRMSETQSKLNKSIVESMPEKITIENEQIMAEILRQNALQINAILEGNIADDVDYRSADLKNSEALETDLIRSQGDKLIDHLGKISATLSQVCDLVKQCN